MRFASLALSVVGCSIAWWPAPAPAQVGADEAVRAALACEEAEHRAWLHSMRVLDERYTMGTRRQLDAALRVATTAEERCRRALAPIRAAAAPLADDLAAAVRDWEALVTEGRRGDRMVSEVLEGLRALGSVETLRGLSGALADGSLTASEALRGSLLRAIRSRHLRSAVEQLQADVNATNSELGSYEAELRDVAGDREDPSIPSLRREVAALRTALAQARRKRDVAHRVLARFRRDGDASAAIASLRSALHADDLPSLERQLRE